MPQSSYAYAIGRIRVLENKLLTREKIDRMVDAPSLDDVLKVLAESEYGFGQEMVKAHDYEKLLSAELEKTYQFIEEVTPNKPITDLFLLQYDIHNLKVLLKSRQLGTDEDELLVGIGVIPLDVLKNAVAKKDYSELPFFLTAVADKLEESFEERVDPHYIDTSLDLAYYRRVFDVAHKRQNAFLKEFFIKKTDLINIRTMLRVKKIGESYNFLKNILIPYGSLEFSYFERAMDMSLEQLVNDKAHNQYERIMANGVAAFARTGDLMVYERLADDYLLSFVKLHKYNPLGIEPIIGYILAKENELKLVRMIMVGKINNIPSDKIRERLRDVYV